MTKATRRASFSCKVTGHKLVRKKVKLDGDDYEETEHLQIELEGPSLDEESKLKVRFLTNTAERHRFPLGSIGEVSFEITQGELFPESAPVSH